MSLTKIIKNIYTVCMLLLVFRHHFLQIVHAFLKRNLTQSWNIKNLTKSKLTKRQFKKFQNDVRMKYLISDILPFFFTCFHDTYCRLKFSSTAKEFAVEIPVSWKPFSKPTRI